MAELCFPPATRAKSIPPRTSWSPPREALRKKDSSELWERAQARALDLSNGVGDASSSNSSEDAFQDSAPRLSSQFASASSGASDYQDAISDINSVASSMSSVEDDDISEGMRSIQGTPNGKSPFAQAAVSKTIDWHAKAEEEQRARMVAEEALEQLQEQRDELQRRLYAMEGKEAEEARDRTLVEPSEPSSEAVVARMVAGIYARVATEDAVGARWASEVARLRQRLEQSARMEAVAERRRQQELAAQETLNQRLLHGGLAASCAGLGVLSVFLVIRRSSRA